MQDNTMLLRDLQDLRDRLVANYNDNVPFEQLEEDRLAVLNALDLINRQKAEIERLTEENKNYIKVAETQQSLSMERFFEIKRLTERIEKRTTELDRLTIYFDKVVEEKLKTAKAEAIKEFAERLKTKIFMLSVHPNGHPHFVSIDVTPAHIDNLVKEMVGDV